MKFTVTIRATSIQIQPGHEAIDRVTPLINTHTFEDEYQEITKVMGFMYDEQNDTLYFHKGIDINYLRRLLGECVVKEDPFHPYKEMKYDFEEIIPPRDSDQVDVIDFLAGQKGHRSNVNDSQLFLVKVGGFGKGLPYSTRIPTPGGFKLMRDIQVGHTVFARDGSPTVVTEIYELGERDVYRITFHDGRYALCDKDHLWKVINRRSNEMVMTTEQLMEVYRRPNKNHMDPNKSKWDSYDYLYGIPVNGVVQFDARDVPIDPWVLGCFIGNGCCTEPILTLSSGNDYIPSKIAEICGFNVKKSKHNYSYRFYYKDGNPVKTQEFFRYIPEMIGVHSRHKSIPTDYLYNSPEVRLRLLQGLMDTDGSISQNETRFHVLYSSTSYKLLKQIKWILYSLGWSGAISVENRGKEKYRSGFCGNLAFRVPNSEKQKLFTYPRKVDIAKRAAEYPQRNIYSKLLIKDIRFDHVEFCKCIKVDNPEHLYLTENFIVTHNTFCTGYAIGLFGAKALIIMHRDSLRQQWYNSLLKMNGFPESRIHEISSTEEFEDICRGDVKLDYDIYLMTHATFRSGLKRVDDLSIASNFTKNLGIGVKVIDEAHLEFKDTLLMDFMFNVKRNIYLTATDGRSQRNENSIFKHVFANAVFYRKDSKKAGHPDKWVEYISVFVNTHVNPNIYRYRVNGGRGMSPVTYGKWVIQRDKRKTHFNVCKELIREIYANEPTAKVIIFMPLIELCTECAYFINELNYDETFKYDISVKTINSHNTKSENEIHKRADVIVTTTQSLGVGVDIKGITDIICCSPFVSKILAKQVMWRIRYIEKKCHYYDIIDTSVPTDVYWWKSRSKVFKQMCSKYISLTWNEGDDNNDTKETN